MPSQSPKGESIYSASPLIRLNKLISQVGVCARRKADYLIAEGQVLVNGQVVRTVGAKVPLYAEISYKGRVLHLQKLRYILLNKPKGYVTTLQDPEGRKTVMNLINKFYCAERICPVGRLDYDTTGLLLLTNDGKLAHKLAHPSSNIKKRYHVVLNKPLKYEHFNHLQQGLLLADGLVRIDCLSIDSMDSCQVELEIHIGKNRIVRRIFEHLGYKVNQLDRRGYAHLNKDTIPCGKWIFLKEKDVIRLKNAVGD